MLTNLKEVGLSLSPSTSRSEQWKLVPSSIWKRFWTYQAFPKIKEFLWRSCAQGVAPTEALYRRQIAVDCHHILLTCPFVRELWLGLQMSFIVPQSGELFFISGF
ncbi:hypothetical protein NE237_023834 [Protea cynaroides]|uniref:Reverse transcriptase zinc-binding domain-containing protein n=1 Tax=Protea cynaroides TaxID=273540 RepID=A0A9Q0HFV3_9MAGN|nr:hypothetical protein NE237_023834 [Protea cynaroides]